MPTAPSALSRSARGWFPIALILAVAPAATAQTAYKQPSFHETAVFSGLTNPTTLRFLPDGSVLVAEKSGLIKKFDSLTDTTPTVVADLRTKVHNFWDRGMLGLAVPPGFDANAADAWRRYVYVLYAHDAFIGGTAPKWGTPGATGDPCPGPPGGPGPTTDGCVVSGHLSRLLATGADWAANEEVLIEDWCQQFPSHSTGALSFGADEKLYVSGGDGASFTNQDWGQFGGTVGAPPHTPKNPCGDPPVPVGGNQVKPTAEGGALRSQSPRRPAGEPRVLGGAILRVDPATGAALPDNPLFGSADANERRIIGYGLRNPFRMMVKPGTNDVWIGDVGWSAWEEINRIPDLSTARNFGWPCWEGNGAQYTGLNICPTQGQTTAPVYTYHHSASVVTGDGCTTGSSSVAGMAFYAGASNYPASFNGALFFSDYSRKCMWIMFPGGNGDPDPANRAAFAASAQGPVDLQIGPDGNLYYADFDGGKVWRVEYGPVAKAAGNPTTGPLPLAVNFSSAGSGPAQPGDTISFAWDLDGDGQYDDSTAANPSWTYTANGAFTVRLRVTDNHGASNVSSPVTITAGNQAPTPTILSPGATLTWRVGDSISFSGSATDPEQGALPASALSWSVIIHHCPSDCHTHLYQTFGGVAGGSFSAPDHEFPAYLEVRLTATDSGGLTGTASVNIQPQTVNLSLQSVPTGLQLTAGTTTAAAPFVKTVIVLGQTGLDAPSPQGLYTFSAWSDGGAASHTVTAPATPATYTAAYTSSGGALPPPWVGQDVGAPSIAGSSSYAGATFTVNSSGWDIWDVQDEFYSVWQTVPGDGSIVARVASFQNAGSWAKAGVMIRESTNPNSRHVLMALTPANGLAFQRRTTTGEGTVHTAGALVPAPYWVRLVRTGNSFSGYSSSDGNAWTLVGSVTLSLPGAAQFGLAFASHNEALGTAVFDNVTVTGATPNIPPTTGITAPANGATFTAPASITIDANASDSDGTVTKVDFFRGAVFLGTDSSSPYSFTWSNVVAGTYSLTTVATDNLGATGTSAPVGVTVNPSGGGGLPPPWVDLDIGPPVIPGSASWAGGTFTVDASGWDIWSNWDEFRFVHQPISGNATITARVASVENTSPWAKVGVMIRESLTYNSRHAMMALTPGNGLAFQRRTVSGGESAHTAGGAATAPYWVRLVRTGNTFQAYKSANGTAWTLVGSVTIAMSANTYIGLALTGHNNSTLCTATFDNVTAVGGTPNAPPTTGITSPANGATFTAPASITINANASDTDGTVSKVDFFQGATLLGTDTTSPYAFTWPNVAAGTYSLTTVATDNLGATGTSAPVSVIVNASPTTGITSPANGATFTAPASIPINANASDSDGTITKVDFFQGATLLGTDATSPYAFTWPNVAAGTYSLTTVATDNRGATGTSAPVSVTVNANALPTTNITSPANGATFTAPASITINASASDTDGTVSKVDFFQGATLLGTDATSPYSFTWPNVAAGTYSLTTVATDNAGGTGTSAPVSVIVNASPTTGITSPANGATFTAPASITINANASDSDGTITKVDFFQGAAFLGTDTSSPYSFTWPNVAAGSYSLTTVATDNRGATGTSAPVGVTVNAPGNIPPTSSITSPANGATFTAPASITIDANASDTDGTVTKVDFFQGATLLGTDATSPYSFTWPNVVAGTYSLTTVATDNAGATGTSAPIGITVNTSGGGLPPPWVDLDIGPPVIPGSASWAGGTFTVDASGWDIWSNWDEFRFVHQPLSGDGSITARVTSVENTNPWAKVGVMIRESLTYNSRHAMMVLTPGNGLAFQRRTVSGGESATTVGGAATAPYWVRITRTGNIFRGYKSANGTTWTQVGSVTIAMPANTYIGLALTSHNNSALCTATLDSVTKTP